MTFTEAHGARDRSAAIKTIVFIAWRQLWERKLLNGIAVGGVSLGVLVLIALSGLMDGFESKFTQTILRISPHVILFDTELRPQVPMLDRLFNQRVVAEVAHQSPSERQARIKRPFEIVQAIRSMSEVDSVAPSIAGTALIEFGGKSKSLDLRGIDLKSQDRVTPIHQFEKAGRLSDIDNLPNAVAVGFGVARDLGLHVGDVVSATSPGGKPMDLRIVSVFECEVPPVDKSRAYTSLRTAQTLLGRPDTISRIEIRLKSEGRAIPMNDTFERVFGYDGESWKESNANLLAIFALQDMVANFVIGAILLLGGFGILAIQIMIVLQKQRDIAILRSVGLRRADILSIFLIQGVIVALVGGLLGDIAGKIAVGLLKQVPLHGEGLVRAEKLLVTEDPAFYIYGTLFALLVGLVASLVPAWRGSRVEPVEVLRGQIG